jgi:hypothetical protein
LAGIAVKMAVDVKRVGINAMVMRAFLLLFSLLPFPALAADRDPLDNALDACLAKPRH